MLAIIDPVALQVGPLQVRWYGIILTGAMFLAVWLTMREAARRGRDPEVMARAALWVLPGGIVGARLYEVFVLSWDYYRTHLLEIPATWLGGMAIHGGLIGGVLAGWWFLRRSREPFWPWADMAAPYVALAQAVGRWGNFFNQEAYGTVAPVWVMNLLPGFIREQMFIAGAYHHPAFLYESLWDLAVFALLLALRARNPRRGVVACAHVAFYNLGRFFIEGIRLDSSFAGGLRVAQVVAAGLLLLGLVAIAWRARTARAHYADPGP